MELFFHRWKATQSHDLINRIVLLHGMGGTGSLWRPLASQLENEMEVLAPDQRGHGLSRVNAESSGRQLPGYAPIDYGRDLNETIDLAAFHPTWILGHSMGVRTACAAAFLRPDQVKGLFLIDLGFSGLAGGGLGLNLARFIRILPNEFKSRADARDFMEKNCPDPSIGQYLMAVAKPIESGKPAITFPFDHSALIQTIEAARDASVRTWVKSLAERKMPIYVFRGANSLVWSKEEFEAEKSFFKEFSNVVFTEVEGAGHGLPFEKRIWLSDTIRKAVKAL